MKNRILFFIAATLLSITVAGQTPNASQKNSVVVRGTAIFKQIPEILSARIAIKVQADKYYPCQEKLTRVLDQAKSVLVKRGIDKSVIRINDLAITEKRDYLSEGKFKISYEGNSAITIEETYSIDYARKLLSALQNDSVAFLYTLDFTLSENQKKDLRQKAIAAAIADAKEKAEAIANSANIKLLKINTITFMDDQMGGYYESDLVQENVLTGRAFAMSKAGAPIPEIDFNPKEIGIRKSITVEWLIEDEK